MTDGLDRCRESDTPDQRALRELVGQVLAGRADAARVARLDRAHEFDHELYAALGEAGLVALEAGVDASEGPSPASQVVVIEELAAGPTSMAVCFVVQYMGVGLLARYGSPQQRVDVLEPLLSGRSRICFAMTEPDGGTDVARAMTTRGRYDGGSWLLSGTKTWISGPRVAEHAVVLARTAQPLPSAVDGITMFLVPLSSQGIRVRELDTVAIHGLDTCEVTFDEVRVGDDAVLGEAGGGFRQVLGTLNGERLNAAAAAAGIARGALDCALGYARQRSAFGRRIGAFQTLQHRLVDDAIKVEAARGLLRDAANEPPDSPRAALLSAMAKVAAADAAVDVTDNGMRLLGGAGVSTEFAMQRYFRDARLYTFAPLTNEMLRNYLGEKLLGLPRSF